MAWRPVGLSGEDGGGSEFLAACRDGDLDKLNRLLSLKADYTQYDEHGWNGAHYSAYLGRFKILKRLMDIWPDGLEERTHKGETALWIAVLKHNFNCIDLLLARKANQDVTIEGLPLVVKLCSYPNAEPACLKSLVEAGCNLTATNDQGSNCLHAAAENGNINVLKYLLKKKAFTLIQNQKAKGGKTALALAVLHNHKHIVKSLLQNSADPDEKDEHGRTAMHDACLSVDGTLVKILADYKKPADIHAIDNEGCKPLHVACASGNDLATKELLMKGADKNALDNENRTPTWHACNRGNLNCLGVLIKEKADAKIVCRSGHSPLQRASLRGHPNVLKHLFTNVKDLQYDRDELCHMAQESKDPDTFEIVTEHVNAAEKELSIPSIYFEQNRSNDTVAARQDLRRNGIPRPSTIWHTGSRHSQLKELCEMKWRNDQETKMFLSEAMLSQSEIVQYLDDPADSFLCLAEKLRWDDNLNTAHCFDMPTKEHLLHGCNPNILSDTEVNHLDFFCQIERTAVLLHYITDGDHVSSALCNWTHPLPKQLIFVLRYSSGKYNILVKKGRMFTDGPTTQLEFDLRSQPHQRHLTERRHDLARVLKTPYSVAVDLKAREVLNNQQFEMIKKKEDNSSRTLTLVDIMVEKSAADYDALQQILKDRKEDKALDVLDFIAHRDQYEPGNLRDSDLRLGRKTDGAKYGARFKNRPESNQSSLSETEEHKQHIQRNLSILSQILPFKAFCDKLMERNKIKYPEVLEIDQSHPVMFDKCKALLLRLAGEPIDRFNRIMDGQQRCFPYFVRLVTDYGTRLKTPSHWEKLDRQVNILKSDLDVGDILDQMRERKILSGDEMEELKNTFKSSDKIEILIGILRRSEPSQFAKFLEILDINHRHVAELLRNGSMNSSNSN